MTDESKIESSVIMVVEDSNLQQKLIKAIFSKTKYRLEFRQSAEAALGHVRRLMPNLILMDIHMLGMNGIEATKIIKNDELTQNIPIILMTGSEKSEDFELGFNSGASDFIRKPFTEIELLTRVKTHLTISYVKSIEREQLSKAERVSDLVDMIGEFTHELSTPVGVAYTAATQLESEIKNLVKAFNDQTIKKSDMRTFSDISTDASKIITSNLERSTQLLSSFKRITVDQGCETEDTIVLKEYINDILNSLRPKLKKTNHIIKIDCADDLTLKTIPGAISQIFINLIMNSIIHGFENVDTGIINIQVARTDEQATIIYTDNGKGADQTVIDRIFDKYYTTRRGKGGSGLGMSIVKDLIEKRLKGSIRCTRNQPKGIRFDIILPLTL